MKLRIMNDELIKLQIDIDVPRSNHRPGLTMKAFFLFPALYRLRDFSALNLIASFPLSAVRGISLRSTFFLIPCYFLLAFSSCHHSTPPEPPPQGKRDYKWTIDTITYSNAPGQETFLQSIWASSPNNVYAVGFNSFGSSGVMYRYNGTVWNEVPLLTREGGNIDVGFYLTSIYGFGSNNIWAVGVKQSANPSPPPTLVDSSFIIHYDGSSWREMPIRRGRSLYTLSGSNANDIWAGGDAGTLYHYNGSVWTKMPFDTNQFVNNIAGFGFTDTYATSVRPTIPDTGGKGTCYFYHWNGSVWTALDSFYEQNPTWKFGLNLWACENHNIYSSTYGVFQYRTGNIWQQLLDNDWPLVVNGSSNYNIFAVGDQGRIFEWNGTDWKRFTEIEYPQLQWRGVWTNNVETFIVGISDVKTYILHGR